jgi:trehalose 6-phosphate phosphatase
VIAELTMKIARLLEAHRSGQPLILLFDYDGTLVPIIQHPALAKLPQQTRTLLHRLAEQPGVTVGILSGRRIDDLKDMVAVPGICYSGVSGMELELDGVQIAHPHATEGREIMAGLAGPLRELAAAYAGACVEDKRFGLTLHYRMVAPNRIEELRARAKQLLQSLGEQIRALEVAMAIEITPALGGTKGSAVRAMAEHAGCGAVPLYAGDEANDRDAFEAALALGGFAIGIGPRAPAIACFRLPDPGALVNLLFGLLEALERPATSCAIPADGRNTAGINPAANRSRAARPLR